MSLSPENILKRVFLFHIGPALVVGFVLGWLVWWAVFIPAGIILIKEISVDPHPTVEYVIKSFMLDIGTWYFGIGMGYFIHMWVING